MMRDNIFLEDVQVPEIVQRKADNAFLAIQEGRSFITQTSHPKSGHKA